MATQSLPDSPGRRRLLKFAALGGAASLLASHGVQARGLKTSARIVIIGAGAGGMAMASRLSRSLDGARITLVDEREIHHYQPGWTMVASGVWQPEKTTRPNARFVPAGVNWIKASATAFDPAQRQIRLNNGESLHYDLLIVATGLQLNYGLIEGMDTRLIGQHGIGSVYASLEAASATNRMIEQWISQGSGRGLFTMAPTAMKCAGAPLKMTFTTLSRLENSGRRDDFEVNFFSPGNRVFSQPWVNDFVIQRFADQGVKRHEFHTLAAIEAERQLAHFRLADGSTRTEAFDFLHVVPPMSAPDAIRQSDLAAQDGAFAGQWLDVDIHTLQHRRYPDVFGIGDVIGAPINKTAASVKAQAPVVEANILAFLQDLPLPRQHNGYTSCPMITGIGKAMLVEFGYNMEFLPSFPFIDPKDESWVTWTMKDKMLQPAYYAVLEGRA